jgi:hypothetical protein
MADSSSASNLRITRLILVPVVITLAVTLLRLLGELQHWSSMFFNRSAGGGGALVGISWLPIIFGPYFAVKLARSSDAPVRYGKAFGFAVLGVLVFITGMYLMSLGFAGGAKPGRMLAGLAVMAVAAALQFIPWGALAKTLTAYAYAARIPVAIVMYYAIRGNWGTHYDALPPEGAIPTAFWLKYIYIALIPQLVMWIAYTIILGALVGTAYAALTRRKQAASAGA